MLGLYGGPRGRQNQHVELSERGCADLDFEVHLSTGASAIDMSRCLMASEAVVGGWEQLLLIDSDMMFDPADAVRLFLRPEPVVAGVYAAKAYGKTGKLNVDFGPDVDGVPVSRPRAGMTRRSRALKAGAGFRLDPGPTSSSG